MPIPTDMAFLIVSGFEGLGGLGSGAFGRGPSCSSKVPIRMAFWNFGLGYTGHSFGCFAGPGRNSLFLGCSVACFVYFFWFSGLSLYYY